MGLKKPSSGGGLPSDVVDKSGAQATFAASTTDSDGTNIRLHSTPTEKTLVDTESTVTSTAPLYSFGDATAADVAAGKTFTSAAGVKVEGTGKLDTMQEVKDFTPTSTGSYITHVFSSTSNYLRIESSSGEVILLPISPINSNTSSSNKLFLYLNSTQGTLSVYVYRSSTNTLRLEAYLGGTSIIHPAWFNSIKEVTL